MTYEHLACCVVARVNFALNCRASLSSDYEGWALASLAVDGNPNGVFNARSCTFLGPQPGSPWWTVDMGTERRVFQILIANRIEEMYVVFSPISYLMNVASIGALDNKVIKK